MAKAKKKAGLSLEERLEQALVPEAEQPYPVPKNWCWVHLGDFINYATDYVANGSFASLKENVNYYKDENYAILVKTQDFSSGFTENLTYTDKKGYQFLKKSVLVGGELILSNIGSIGKIFRVPILSKPMTLAPNSIMIKCFRESDYDFLFYYLLSPLGTELLLSITTGTAVKKFNKTDLKTIFLPIPPLTEQQRIVDRIERLFAKLNEAKEKAQAALDSFETRKAAILHKAFTGELTSKWREENGVGMDSWKETTLSNIVSGFKYGTSEKSDYSNSGMPVFRIPNITDDGLSFDDLKYLPHYDVSDESQIHENDILIVRSNGSRDLIGKCVLIPLLNKPYAYASFLIRIRPSHATIPEFLVTYLNSSGARLQMFKKAKSSAGINNINSKELGALTLTLPTIPEQAEIVHLLDNFFAKEQKAKELCSVLDKIDLIKKSILARAFRGELGTNDPTEESALNLITNIV